MTTPALRRPGRLTTTTVLAAVSLLLPGCRGCGEVAVDPPASPTPVAAASPIVSIAADVAKRWESVTVAVLGSSGSLGQVTLTIGGASAPVAGSPLSVELVAFAPNFQMNSATQDVSSDAEPKNPAAKLRVSEAGKTVFEGWVFPFEGVDEWSDDPRYDLRLASWHERENTK